MHVLVVSSKYPPEYSGSGLRAHRTYQRISKRYGVTFTVICNSTELTNRARYHQDGVSVTRIASSFMSGLSAWSRWPSTIRRFLSAIKYHQEASQTRKILRETSFDLIHVFGASASTAEAISWSRRVNKPMIMEIVNLPFKTPFQHLPGMKRFNQYELKTNCVIVAISHQIGEVCAKHGLETNVWVRPNPVDDSIFYPDPGNKYSIRRRISKFRRNDTVLVYIAQIIPRKNHRFLLEVLSQLPRNYRLILGGPLAESGQFAKRDRKVLQGIKKQILDLDLQDRVDLQVGTLNMADYFKAADISCFPASEEAMGTPMLESLMAGIPVVANSGEPSFREWIKDGENGYLCSFDATEWATAIKATSRIDDQTRDSFAQEVKMRASSTVIDHQYYDLMTDLLKSPNSHVTEVAKVLN